MRAIRFLIACLAATAALAASAAAQGEAHIDRTKLEAFVDGVVRHAMDEQHIAGMGVAVIDRSGPLLLKGYGIAGHGRTAGPGTLFRVGSISKTVTWIAIMQLVEKGKLTLDDPVNAHLPTDLQIPDEGFGQPIRIRHLMSHSAGFEDSALGVNVATDVTRALPLRDYLKRYRVHRVRAPGVLTVYSNYGAALAGAIVEHESGETFPDYAEKHILRPLGMPTATFREPWPDSFVKRGFPGPLDKNAAARVSSGFKYVDGAYVEQSWEFLPHMAPAGAMSASAYDMATYMEALLEPERFEQAHVLKTATVLEMRKPLMRNDPRLGGSRHGFWEVAVPDGEFAFGHSGGMAFQQTNMIVYPESGIAIFVAMNTASLNGGPPIVGTLPKLIAQEFLNSKPVQRVKLAPGVSAAFAGCYRPLRRPYYRTERAMYAIVAALCVTAKPNGDLLAAGNAYVPVGNDTYARSDGSDRIAFGVRDGRMMAFNFSGEGPLERIGFFSQPNWFMAIGVLALLAALLRLLGGTVRVLGGRETAGDLAVDGTGALWLAAQATFAAAVLPWLADFSQPLLNYPGALLPVACWLFLIAAVATGAVVALLAVRRPRDWNWIAWTGTGFTLAIFATFAVTLFDFGLLGFSGW